MMKKLILVELLFVLMLFGAQAQIEMKFTGTRFIPNDINDLGQVAGANAVYDYFTDEHRIDSTADLIDITGINNEGGMSAQFRHPNSTDNQVIEEPAYKLPGQSEWTRMGFMDNYDPVPGDFSSSRGMSENSRYITGLVSRSAFQGLMYLYDTELDTMYNFHDGSIAENSHGYSVNNKGTVAGWMDPIGGGTLRVPVQANPNGYENIVEPSELTIALNAAEHISTDGSLIVGDINAQAFIYYRENDSLALFPAPPGYNIASFTGVSEDGLCVGYAWNVENPSILVREAIIYHPSFGENIMFLVDFLEEQGFMVPFDQTDVFVDGRMGTATSISDDGRFICGYGNVPNPTNSNSRSWVLFLDDFSVSTNDLSESQKRYTVYPNPGNHQLSINCTDADNCNRVHSLRFIDSAGKVVLNQKYQRDLSTEQLKSGLYYIQLLDEEQNILQTSKWTKVLD